MNKKDLSERDICTKFITPAIQRAGWPQTSFREELNLTKGRVVVRGQIIDGDRMASLMIEHGVGVSAVKTYAFKRVDSDYFESE